MDPSIDSYGIGWQPNGGIVTSFYDSDNSGQLRFNQRSDIYLDIWTALSPSAIPFTCPLSGLKFIVRIAFEQSLPTDTISLQPAEGSLPNTVLCTTQWASIDGVDRKMAEFTVHLQPNQDQIQTPWSINQAISWTVSLDGAEPIPVSGAGTIEVYGIYEPQPEYFQKEGIPVELLRLFVPPSVTSNLQNEQDWINWVTNVCQGKQDPKGTPGQLRENSKDHWLRYNVWNGDHSFVSETGGIFSLSGWLKAYLSWVSDPTSSMILVNCFDQAAIVETALSLGMFFKRLHWEVVAPFGYIDEDLTGWGSTNSPFFEGDTQNIRFSDVADPMRTPFRSHVFITISPTETYVQASSMVVDACAGPVCGDLTYTDYLAQKALHDGIQLLELGHDLPQAPYLGVSATNGNQTGWTLNYRLSDWQTGTPVAMDDALNRVRTSFSDSSSVLAEFSAEAVISAIFNPIVQNQESGFVLKPQSNIKTVANDTSVSGVSSSEPSVAGKVVNGPPTFVSFKISVFSGGLESAVAGLQERLGRFTLPAKWIKENQINIKGDPVDSAYIIGDKRAIMFGTEYLDVFVYKNTLVEVAGNCKSVADYRPGWTQALWAELAKY